MFVLILVLVLVGCGCSLGESMVASAFHKSIEDALKFGPFRPGLLHGVIGNNESIRTGVLWMPFNAWQDIDEMRHECEMNEVTYDYSFNNPFVGSKQTIVDSRKLKADIHYKQFSGGHGQELGGFHSHLHFQSLKNAKKDARWSVFYYVHVDDKRYLLTEDAIVDAKTHEPIFKLYVGMDTDNDDELENRLAESRLHILFTKDQFYVHQIKDVLKNFFRQTFHDNYRDKKSVDPMDTYILPKSGAYAQGNLVIYQLVFTEAVGIYASISPDFSVNHRFHGTDRRFKHFQNDFAEKFDSVFDISPQKGFPINLRQFARTTFSNLIGGLGLFHGNPVVADEPQSSVKNDSKLSLLTFSPSRPFFPRGFLWDEGFHQLLAVNYFPSLSLHIIKGWLDIMDDNGWIMREVILGDEARARVPPEFQTQFANYANPPTLILPVVSFLKSYQRNLLRSRSVLFDQCVDTSGDSLLFADESLVKPLISELYVKFKKHFDWFKRTQCTEKSSKSSWECRWRGRSPGHCLTSGLDDYPRARVPSNEERHVDLISWMGFYSLSLGEIADFLELKEDVDYFRKSLDDIKTVISRDYWQSGESVYADFARNKTSMEKEWIIHKGYISLFPFLFNLTPEQHVKSYFQLIRELRCKCGIRSLHPKDVYYSKDEDYWRGKVWINMNYLVLRSLKLYYWHLKEARVLYNGVRKDIVQCMFKVWTGTGYVFEQYDDIAMVGRRSRPFNGWSSLVVSIMAEKY